jgi:hypothetical protein
MGVRISQNSSVDIGTGYGLDDRGLTPGWSKIFPLLHSMQIKDHPTSHATGTGGFFLGR